MRLSVLSTGAFALLAGGGAGVQRGELAHGEVRTPGGLGQRELGHLGDVVGVGGMHEAGLEHQAVLSQKGASSQKGPS